ncbi:MAG: cellulase family glycosylhydrolase [Pseudomonadota bacterium]
MQWDTSRAQAWYQEQPFPVGANFIPSTAINQLEMWQADTFDPDTIERELGYASRLGMNIMRVYLHDLLWPQDSDGFCHRIDTYLDIASNLGIKTMFVLFDDCWNQESALGQQPDPVPFVHNSGWVQSPGVKVVNNPNAWARLETYVTELMDHFKDDERIAVWDLYNEPGNGTTGDSSGGRDTQGERTLPLLKAVFEWARTVEGLSQPITAGAWHPGPEYKTLRDFSFEHSDILTFHSYRPPEELESTIQRFLKYERPMICTEYMSRGAGSTFPACLPILKKYNVGAINWGLVAGKTQTIYPWGWSAEKGEPDLKFHDIFHPDGSMLYPDEKDIFNQVAQAR